MDGRSGAGHQSLLVASEALAEAIGDAMGNAVGNAVVADEGLGHTARVVKVRRMVVAGALMLAGVGGCWVPAVSIVGAEWSDDDQMFAILVEHVDVPRRDGEIIDSDTPTRRRGRQIYVVPADLSEDAWPVTPVRDDASESCLMSGAGYLAEVRDGTRVVTYSLDGEERLLFDAREPALADAPSSSSVSAMLPSPDGSRIAVSLTEDGQGRGTFALFDSESGQEISGFPGIAPGIQNLRWTEDNEVFVVDWDEDGLLPTVAVWDDTTRAFSARPTPTGCRGEPTTCGRLSAEGVWLNAGGDLEHPATRTDDPKLIPEGLLPFDCAFDE